VLRSRGFATQRTDRHLVDMHDKAESVGVAFDAIENQDVRAWKKGLRMAVGEVPLLPKTKTFFS